MAFQVWLQAARGKKATDPQSHSSLHRGEGLTLAAGFVVFVFHLAHFDSVALAQKWWGGPSTDNKHSTFNTLQLNRGLGGENSHLAPSSLCPKHQRLLGLLKMSSA